MATIQEVNKAIAEKIPVQIARENLKQEYQEQERELKQELEYKDMLQEIGIDVL